MIHDLAMYIATSSGANESIVAGIMANGTSKECSGSISSVKDSCESSHDYRSVSQRSSRGTAHTGAAAAVSDLEDFWGSDISDPFENLDMHYAAQRVRNSSPFVQFDGKNISYVVICRFCPLTTMFAINFGSFWRQTMKLSIFLRNSGWRWFRWLSRTDRCRVQATRRCCGAFITCSSRRAQDFLHNSSQRAKVRFLLQRQRARKRSHRQQIWEGRIRMDWSGDIIFGLKQRLGEDDLQS